MKKLFTLLFALVATTALWAHDFQVDGIYYNILTDKTNEVEVTDNGFSSYSGSIAIPSTVTYNGTTYSVTSIGDDAFYYCSGLTSITIPNSVTSIGDYAFRDCSGLTSITIPNSVTSIGMGTFDNTQWFNNQHDGVIYINQVLYRYKGTMPTNTSFQVKEGTICISGGAFYGCSSLVSIDIPSSVVNIGMHIFYYCDSLIRISVDPANTVYDSRDNCNGIIETKTNSLIAGCQKTILPNSLETIKYGSISACTNLTSIFIPKSVKKIESGSFCACPSLVSIIVEKDNPVYDNRNKCNAIIETATNTLIVGCQKTVIPNTVTNIGDSAFYYCSTPPFIIIPNGVTRIGEGAFNFCFSLTFVVLPNSLTEISGLNFLNCQRLKSVYCYATILPKIDLGSFLLSTSTTLYVPCKVLDDYKNNYDWSNSFMDIQCISSDGVETDSIVINAGTTDVTITWPTDDNADTYTIVIEKDGKVVCTLTFNSNGQLLNIAFAPGREGNHPAQYAEATTNGYRFTVTGLEEGTDYTYTVTSKDAANKTISEHSGEFTTQSTTALDNINSSSSNVQKIIRDGQLLIIRDGKTYNAQGVEL